MASDLISRSALIEAMNASKRQPTSDENIEGYCEGWNDLADIINEQPTAYDVDAVVDALWDEQLDARRLMNEGKEWGAGCYSGLQIAIETMREFEKAGVKNENNN